MNLVKRFQSMRHRHNLWTVWSDFLLMGACAWSNRFDPRRDAWEDREAQYMEAVRRYNREEIECFCRALAEVEIEINRNPRDVLGQAFMELELGNKWVGQFFTPNQVSGLLGGISLDEHVGDRIAERGFITVCDPAVGGGSTIIGMFNAMVQRGFNPRRQMHVCAMDVDIKSVHMTYLQLSMLGVPAVVEHGNSLSLETWSIWRTKAHILGRWDLRLAAAAESQESIEPAPQKAVTRDTSRVPAGKKGRVEAPARSRAAVR